MYAGKQNENGANQNEPQQSPANSPNSFFAGDAPAPRPNQYAAGVQVNPNIETSVDGNTKHKDKREKKSGKTFCLVM